MADSGVAALDDMIARMRTLAGPTVGLRVATKAAPLVDAAIKKTASAGKSPTGQPWKPKKDGGKPLVHAASHIDTRAHGNLVVTTLTGPDVYHQLGTGHLPVRQIIPDSGTIPDDVERALLAAATDVFREITSGSG
jgi:hypothetical protein